MTTYRPERGADDHARHDQPLIVAFASGDVTNDEARSARELTASCRRCAALADEIALVSRSISESVGAPRRPRDFRLSEDDATRLRAGPLQRFLRRVGGPGTTMLQPLAGAALAIGLVLVIATGAYPRFGLGAGGGSGSDSAADTRTLQSNGESAGGRETPVPAPAALASPLASAEDGGGGAIDTPDQPTKALLSQAPGIDPGLLAGLVLLIGGTVLLILRLVARRLSEDPLLR